MSVLSSTQDQPKYKHKPESMVFKTGFTKYGYKLEQEVK